MKKEMNRFMLMGYLLAFMIEAINLGFIQGDWWSLIVVVFFYQGIAIYASYRVYVAGISKWAHFISFGVLGIIAELILYGGAQYVGGLYYSVLIAAGTFGHWATIAVAPRLLFDGNYEIRERKQFLNVYMFGVLIIYALGMFLGSNFIVVFVYGKIVLYAVLMYWFIRFFNE